MRPVAYAGTSREDAVGYAMLEVSVWSRVVGMRGGRKGDSEGERAVVRSWLALPASGAWWCYK